MVLKDEIKANLNQALKEKELLEISVLRQLLAAVLNKEKEKRFIDKEKKDVQLTEEEMLKVISFEAKKRREAIKEFEKGKRQDLVEEEKKELEILEKYLPEQLQEEEIKNLAKKAIGKVAAQGLKDTGKVMQELMPWIKGKADGNLVSKIVKELLKAPKN